MASNVTGKKHQYEGNELLDEFLLNKIVASVNILKLRTFASCLKVSQTEYDRITAPNTFTQNEQIQRVLDEWFQARPLTYSVLEFLHEVKKWQSERFVNRNVWVRLQQFLKLELLNSIERASEEPLQKEDSNSAAVISYARELTPQRLLKLANQITDESQLQTLALLGLGMDESTIDGHLRQNSIKIAAHKVLKQWRNSQPDLRTAYTAICEALKHEDVKMKYLIDKALQ